MPPFTLPVLRNDAEQAWHSICTSMGLPPATAAAVWRALCASQNPECRAVVYHLQRIGRAAPATRRRESTALFYGPAAGQRLLALLEDFARSGRLTRAQATTVQEALLNRMGAGGQWLAPSGQSDKQ